MGSVNTGLTKYCNCYRTLESIHPLFDANTPIYLVVDEMKYDRAEYDVDVTLTAPVSKFWKSYPENGKTHVEITTALNTNGNVIRTVTCTCESGRVYRNIFTRKNTKEYNGPFDKAINPSTSVPTGLYFNDIEIAIKYAIDPKMTHADFDISIAHFNDIIDTLYGADSGYDLGHYVNIGVKSSGYGPNDLITNDRLFNFAWWLMNHGVAMSEDDSEMSGLIPEISMYDKIQTFSHALDIQTIPYLMMLYIGCNQRAKTSMKSMLDSWLPTYPRLDFTIYDLISMYIATSQWSYSGWSCIELKCENIPCTIAGIEADSDGLYSSDYNWATGNMCDIIRYRTYAPKPDVHNTCYTNVNINNTIILGKAYNTLKIPAGALELYNDVMDMHTIVSSIVDGVVPFKPVDVAKIVFYIDKAPDGGFTKVSDTFIDLPETLCVTSNGDFSSADMIVATLTYNGATSTFELDVDNVSSNATCECVADIDIRSALDSMPIKSVSRTTITNDIALSEKIVIDDSPIVTSRGAVVPVRQIELVGNIDENISFIIASGQPKSTSNPSNISFTQPTIRFSNHNMIDSSIVWETDLMLDANSGDETAVTDSADLGKYRTSGYIRIPKYNSTNTVAITAVGSDVDMVKYPYILICSYNSAKTLISAIPVTFTNSITVKDVNVELGSDAIYFRVCTKFITPENISIYDNQLTSIMSKSTSVKLPEMRSIGDISDRLYRNDKGWVLERNVMCATISAMDVDTSATDDPRTYVTFNDTLCRFIYDIDASTPASGVYVFHIHSAAGESSDNIGYLDTGIPVASSTIYSTTAITDMAIPIGSEVTGGKTPITDIGEYAITFQTNGTDPNKQTQISATLADDGITASGCKYTYRNVYRNGLRYDATNDIHGHDSVYHSYKILSIACKLTTDSDNPITEFLDKLKATPIKIYYAPKFEFNTTYGCYVTPYKVSLTHNYFKLVINTSNDVSVYITDYIPRDVYLDADTQAALDSLLVYPNGIVTIDYKWYAPCKSVDIKYAIDPTKYLASIEARLSALE